MASFGWEEVREGRGGTHMDGGEKQAECSHNVYIHMHRSAAAASRELTLMLFFLH